MRKVTVSRNVIFCESASTRETLTEDIKEEKELILSAREEEEPDEQRIEAARTKGNERSYPLPSLVYYENTDTRAFEV